MEKKNIFEENMKEFVDAILKSVGKGDRIRKDVNGLDEGFFSRDVANFFVQLVTEQNPLRQVFNVVDMPTRTFSIPSLLKGAKAYYGVAGSNVENKNPQTSAITLNAKKLMAEVTIPTEDYEDPQGKSSINKLIAGAFIDAMVEAEINAMINGDTEHTATKTNENDATESDWYIHDARLAFDGLLKLGLNGGKVINAGGADANVDVIREILYRLGKYGKNKQEVVIFWNGYSANQLLGDTSIKTVDKYGNNATILTGEIGKAFGTTNIDLGGYLADGYVIATVKKNVYIGDRRQVKSRSKDEVESDSIVTVASERIDMKVATPEAIVVVQNLAEPTIS